MPAPVAGASSSWFAPSMPPRDHRPIRRSPDAHRRHRTSAFGRAAAGNARHAAGQSPTPSPTALRSGDCQVASGIAALSERCIVLGLLRLQLGNPPPILILVSEHPFGLLSPPRLPSALRHAASRLRWSRQCACRRRSGIAVAPKLHVRLFASVDRPRIATGVENAESTTAARKANETGQQGGPHCPDFVSPTPL
jgi:hypothetical protein